MASQQKRPAPMAAAGHLAWVMVDVSAISKHYFSGSKSDNAWKAGLFVGFSAERLKLCS